MIRRLSEDVRGHLRTGVALTSVAQCIEELVLNSVDAGASCVAVRLDLQSLTVQVVDNGQGIAKDQLPYMGERYSTSKCHSMEDLDNLRYFGYRGEALASLCSASSLVEIITRPPGSTSTYSKCFHKGKPLSVTEASRPRPGTGTTVTARNLFYNLPVRKKSLNEGLELEKTRFRISGLALMWPLISFSLRDDITGNVILQTHKCSSILATFASLFGGSRTKHMREVETRNEMFKISGYVSRENYSRKDLQFVFVNRRLVLKSKVHKLLNTVLGKSVLVRRRGNTADRSKQTGQEKGSGDAGSPTKLFERYAVYVINIDCPLSVYDITFDPAKTLVEFHDWSELTSLVEAMLLKFLKEENLLLPEEGIQETDEESYDHAAVSGSEHVAQTSDLCETDDPFNGADEPIDEEFHDALQRKQYTQGIDVHGNTYSLFSRTVRRPATSHEQEDFVDLCVSSPKKSRLDINTHHIHRNPENQKGPLEYNRSNDNTRNSRTVLKAAVGECCDRTVHRQGTEDTEDAPAHQQLYKPDNRENLREVSSDCGNSDSVDELENENMEIVLPQFYGPSKKMIPQTSHKKALTEEPHIQAESSASKSAVKEICLPQEFAQSSSLSRLRARLAGHFQPSSSNSTTGSSAQSTPSMSAVAVLQKFHRTEKYSVWNRREQKENTEKKEEDNVEREEEENIDFEEETETVPTEIVLPPMTRPPLFRSKSLDAECSCYCVRDTSFQHKHSDTSVLKVGTRFQVCDDSAISYSGSRQERNHFSPRACCRTSDFTKRRRQSFHSCMEQNASREENVLHLSSNKCTDPIGRPRNISSTSGHLAQIHENVISRSGRSEIKRGSNTTVRPAPHSQGYLDASDIDQSMSKTFDHHEQTLGQPEHSHSSCTKPVPPDAVLSTTKSSAAAQSSTRADLNQHPAKLGGLSQASKLSRLMRKVGTPNLDQDYTGPKEMNVCENPVIRQAHCSQSSRNERFSQIRPRISTLSHRSSQESRAGQFQAQRQDESVLRMLNESQPPQTSCQLRDSHSQTTGNQPSTSARFSALKLFETPQTVLQSCNSDCMPVLSTQSTSAEPSHLKTISTLQLFQTPHTVFSASDSVTGHTNAQTRDCASNFDLSSQRRSQRGGDILQRSAVNCATTVRHEPYPASSLAGRWNIKNTEQIVAATGHRREHIDPSGDMSGSGFDQQHEVYTVGSQGSTTAPSVWDGSTQTDGVSNESSERVDPSQQDTQGFAPLSSQGFVPRTAEMDTMSLELAPDFLSHSITQTDSPRSTGFSPAVSDPLLLDGGNENSLSPALVQEKTDVPAAGLCSVCPDKISPTETAVGINNAAESSPPDQTESRKQSMALKYQTTCRSGEELPTFHTRVEGSELRDSGTGSSVYISTKKDQTGGSVQQHGVSQKGVDSQEVLYDQKHGTFPCNFQETSAPNTCPLSPGYLQPSCQETEREGSPTTQTTRVNLSDTTLAFELSTLPSMLSPTGTTSAAELPALTCRTSLSETTSSVESPAVSSSVNLSTISECQNSLSFSTVPNCVETTMEGHYHAESSLNRHQASQEQKEPNSDYEHQNNYAEGNGMEQREPDSQCKQSNCGEKDSGYELRTCVCPDKKQISASHSASSEGPSQKSKTEAKQKMVVDRTYSLSFLTEKRTKTSIQQSADLSAGKDGPHFSPVGSQSCSERHLLNKESAKRVSSLHKIEETRSVSSSQQNDSFSDSIPDSALASIAMPGILTPNTSVSFRDVNSPDSLPDSVLANVTMPASDSLRDSVLANVTMPASDSLRDSVPASVTMPETDSLPDNVLAGVTMPASDSLPDSVLASVSMPEKEASAEPATDAHIFPSMSDSVTDSILASVDMLKNQSPAKTVSAVGEISDSVSDSMIVQACTSENDVMSKCFHAEISHKSFDTPADKHTTPDAPVASLQSVNSDCFTQNAYNLGCALSPVSTNNKTEEHINLNSLQSQTADCDDDSSDKRKLEHEEDKWCSSDRDASLNDTMALKEKVGMGNGERQQTGADSGEDRVKEVMWVPVVDPFTGCTVYMNSSSGHTLTVAQWNEREMDQINNKDHSQVAKQRQSQTTSMKTRSHRRTEIEELSPHSHRTLKALLSSHFEAEEMEAQSKWRDGSKEMLDAEMERNTVVDILTGWENPVFKKPEQILQTVTRHQAGKLAHCFFQPTAFNKSMLSGAKVIGQLDNKFVACLIQEDSRLLPSTSTHQQDNNEGGLVVLFDQHAAHERIRLEQLLADVYEKGETACHVEKKRIKRCDVQPPRTMDLLEEDVRLMQAFREEFDRIGVKFDVDKARRDRVHAHTMPACMAQREANDQKRGKDPLSYEYLQLLMSTAGAKQQLPQQVHRLLATHACKGAIKFGDKLSVKTCQELLSSLSSCDLPFQCAHGRPSIAPLISLTQLQQATTDLKPPPSLWKLRQRATAVEDQ